MPPSVVGTMIGAPAALRIGAPSVRLKLPLLKSAVGTAKLLEKPVRSKVPSQLVKKNNLLFSIGPPRLTPLMLRLPSGFSLAPARFSSHVNARIAVLSKVVNAVPRKKFVPDLVMTVTAAPPVIPCSASKLLVEILTSCTLSIGAT